MNTPHGFTVFQEIRRRSLCSLWYLACYAFKQLFVLLVFKIFICTYVSKAYFIGYVYHKVNVLTSSRHKDPLSEALLAVRRNK